MEHSPFNVAATITPQHIAFNRNKLFAVSFPTRWALGYSASSPDRFSWFSILSWFPVNHSAVVQGGLRPHHYCLPILKREEHSKSPSESKSTLRVLPWSGESHLCYPTIQDVALPNIDSRQTTCCVPCNCSSSVQDWQLPQQLPAGTRSSFWGRTVLPTR